MPDAPSVILDPSLASRANEALQVLCVCQSETIGYPSSLAVQAESDLTDTAVRFAMPFYVTPTQGPECSQICGQLSRCLGGVTSVQAYSPNMSATNSGYPGVVFIQSYFEKTSTRSCD